MYQVEWTEYGKDAYAELLDSIMALSLDAAISLDEKIEKLTDSLATFSHICPRSVKIPRYRRCVVTKQISMLYEIRGRMIFVIAVLDNRAEHLLM
ncbi:MAG: type II toxin-antitoxin system RelE/ParE family toxin [Saprospiraceae bacterium]|nr:type II toxin-antitoxin system RelE/ParE family toxin [Saprospiraceae bacterium]